MKNKTNQGYLNIYLQKEKPTEIIHNALNPSKTSTKIPVIGARRNMSAFASKDKQKSRQPQIDNKPEVLIENNDFHEYGDQPLKSSEIVQPKNFSQRHSSEFVFTTNKNEQNLGKYQEYDPTQSQKSNQLPAMSNSRLTSGVDS